MRHSQVFGLLARHLVIQITNLRERTPVYGPEGQPGQAQDPKFQRFEPCITRLSRNTIDRILDRVGKDNSLAHLRRQVAACEVKLANVNALGWNMLSDCDHVLKACERDGKPRPP